MIPRMRSIFLRKRRGTRELVTLVEAAPGQDRILDTDAIDELFEQYGLESSDNRGKGVPALRAAIVQA